MQFLLTNDDGVEARGLALLREVLAGQGEVTVLAPVTEQSGVGHRVTTRGELLLETREERHHALNGTPADCVRVALRGLSLAPDWVFSGLNHGGNLGVDIPMSGTVAAAREAVILGHRAVAISQVLSASHRLDPVHIRALTARVISALMGADLPAGRMFNVNLPFAPESPEPEIVFCTPDPSPHDVRFERAATAFTYSGVFLQRPYVPGSDVDVVLRGKIAVSILAPL